MFYEHDNKGQYSIAFDCTPYKAHGCKNGAEEVNYVNTNYLDGFEGFKYNRKCCLSGYCGSANLAVTLLSLTMAVLLLVAF